MILLEDIFAEYVTKRHTGMSSNEALNLLRQYIEPLEKEKKRKLADDIRNFEEKQGVKLNRSEQETPDKGDNAAPPKKADLIIEEVPQTKIKSLHTTQTSIKSTTDILPQQAPTEWMICIHCDAKNRADSVFCYACGNLLDQVQSKYGTRKFSDGDTSHLDPAYFGEDSVLVLRVQQRNYDYKLQPQNYDHELVIGRSTDQSAMIPDIDLAQHHGEQFGVSRLHMAISYISKDQTLQIHDLGSVNGSFINGQKIHPNEVRILRDGDQIRLGKMILLANFSHPDNEDS